MREFFFRLWLKIWSTPGGRAFTFVVGIFVVFVLFAMGSEWVTLKIFKGTHEQAENVAGYGGTFGMILWLGFMLTQFLKRKKSD